MPITQQQLTDPQVLAAVSRLEFHSREIVEGFISGLHRSPYHGFSVEFAQHREYSLGDEIRYIDWKVAARSDRYYVKEFEEETNLKAQILVDTSASMLYRGKRATHSKLDYARILAAALATLLLRQRDATGLVLFSDGIQREIPARATGSHLTQILEELVLAVSPPKSSLGATFHTLAEQYRRRGVVMIFSDCFDDVEGMLAGLRHFRHRRHELVVFQILDDDELTFPFHELTKFEGLEDEPELLADPRGVRDAYLAAMTSFCARLESGCREMKADLVRVNTSELPSDVLSRYLAARSGRR